MEKRHDDFYEAAAYTKRKASISLHCHTKKRRRAYNAILSHFCV